MNKRPSNLLKTESLKECPILEQLSPTSNELPPLNPSNNQRLNSKPKINHHFINPANADEAENQNNKDPLFTKMAISKTTSISPSLSLNQISKNGAKYPLTQSASLRNNLIDATAPAKSQLCSGFRLFLINMNRSVRKTAY